jgi:hypothetical protein
MRHCTAPLQNTPEAAPKEVTKPSNETMCPEGCHTLKLKCAAIAVLSR